ncbi:MAG: hypothetical protein IPO78_02845 [Saprospiraceae bacterium]|nr:hypothetical protein [Saprospiraceae bacterium]
MLKYESTLKFSILVGVERVLAKRSWRFPARLRHSGGEAQNYLPEMNFVRRKNTNVPPKVLAI